MKRSLGFIFALLFLLTALGCNPKSVNDGIVKGTISRSCTGTFFVVNDHTFNICNIEAVEGIKENTEVSLRYEEISDCDNNNLILCMLYLEFDAWVEVSNVL